MSGLEGYELEEVLGAGGLARVHRARRLVDGGAVAVKIAHDPRDPAARRRMQREAEVLDAVSHPRLLRLIDVIDDTHLALVTELVPGGPLTARLGRAGPLPAPAVADLLVDLADGVDTLHRRGFIHRDIKPANVLLDAEGRPVLADLACAVPIGGQTSTTTGTAEYLDPAVADGLAADERSDVYALGILAYELLTGAPPYTGDAPLAVLRAADRGAAVPLGEACVDGELAAIVHRAMARAPHQRYPHAGALGADLRRWAATADRAKAPLEFLHVDERADTTTPTTRAGHPPAGRTGGPARPEPSEASPLEWLGESEEDLPPPSPAHAPPHGGAAAGMPTPTLEFGPRPPKAANPPPPRRRRPRSPLVALLAAVLLIAPSAAVALSGGFTSSSAQHHTPGSDDVAASPPDPDDPAAGSDRAEPADGDDLTSERHSDGVDTGEPQARRTCPLPSRVGPDALVGDVTGDGCVDVVRFSDGVLTLPAGVGGGRYAVGRSGDVGLLGDFDCSGIAQLAIYRPAAGLLWHFSSWPAAGEALRSRAPLQVGVGQVEVIADGDCDAVIVRPTTASSRALAAG